MRILLIGGTGLLGSAIHARLSAEGHACVLLSRHPTVPSDTRHVALDMARTTDAARWKSLLAGVDAVINAAGALQGQDMQGVHVAGSAGLYTACESAGVRRVILFSAIGTTRDAPSEFSRTKREGEAILMARDLDWVVLRPSIVVGRAAYGAARCCGGWRLYRFCRSCPTRRPFNRYISMTSSKRFCSFCNQARPHASHLIWPVRGRWHLATPSRCFATGYAGGPLTGYTCPRGPLPALTARETSRRCWVGDRPSTRRHRRKCGAARPAIPSPGVRRRA